MRKIIAAVFLALFAISCASTAPGTKEPDYITVQIENRNYNTASVHFGCRTDIGEIVRGITLNQTVERRVELGNCQEIVFFVTFVPSTVGSFMSPPITARDGDCLDITIGHLPQHTSWLPCGRA